MRRRLRPPARRRGCFALFSGSTWMVTAAPCTSALSAASMRSQMACGVGDAHRPRHHQVELDEGRAPGVPRAEVVRLERALRLLGDRLADLLQHVLGHRLVHQPSDRLPHQHPSPPQDVQRDESGDDRVEHQPVTTMRSCGSWSACTSRTISSSAELAAALGACATSITDESIGGDIGRSKTTVTG